MPIIAQKQGKETTQSLVRRFTQKLRKSGTLLEVRKRQFHKKSKSRPLLKRSALRRLEKKQEFAKQRKLTGAPTKTFTRYSKSK
ncbi:MAG: hypothetical protein PHY72_01420 [Candidatus Pacebacteria bacterium]|nr:hypothetical protein [Candidatus Paceibacterota bacterium]